MRAMTSSCATPLQPNKAAPLLIPALLACYLVWGSTYLAIRLALLSFPPFFQMGTRFLTAGIVLRDSQVEIDDTEIKGTGVGIEIRGTGSSTVRANSIRESTAEGILIHGTALEGHLPEERAQSVHGADPETVLRFKVEKRGGEYWAVWGTHTPQPM